MANSCVSSLRFNSPIFSYTNNPWPSSSEPSSLPFESLRSSSRKSRKLTGDRKNLSLTKAVQTGESHSPEKSSRQGIWSIRDDLEVPSSPFFPAFAQGGQRGPQQGQDRLQGAINQLFKYRIIRCCGKIDDRLAKNIVGQLLYLGSVDPDKDIVMYVNSPGGSVTAGMAIFDAMRFVRPDVSTICLGMAASMGAFLLCAGAEGKRFSLPNSRVMIRQPISRTGGGRFSDVIVRRNELAHHKSVLLGYLAYRTGQTLDQITKDTNFDFFMSAQEAKDYGMIDAIIQNTPNPLRQLAADAA